MDPKSDNKFINFFLYNIDEIDTSILALSLLVPFLGNFWGTWDYYLNTLYRDFDNLIFAILLILWMIAVIANLIFNRVPSAPEKYHLAQIYFLIVSFLSIGVITSSPQDLSPFSFEKNNFIIYTLINNCLTWFFLFKSAMTIFIIRSLSRYNTLLSDKYQNTQINISHIALMVLIMPIIYAVHSMNHSIITSVYLTFVYTSSIFTIFRVVAPVLYSHK